MSESHSPRGVTPASSIPQKRSLEDEHAPAVSSPLNPDIASSTKVAKFAKDKEAIQRERREKKETLKKREAKGGGNAARGTPDPSGKDEPRQSRGTVSSSSRMTPLRYKLAPPPAAAYRRPVPPVFALHHTKPKLGLDGEETDFYEISDTVFNRKGFRYTTCFADAQFPATLYRQAETAPYKARMSFEDCSSHILLDKTASQISTNKGFRMARANVGVREGRWYWECKITSGIAGDARRSALTADKDAATSDATKALEATGHVRMGWARREACLDAPIGFDAYSYGLRDVAGQKVHMSRPVDFFPPDVSIVEGDVIGLEINLPSLALHQKIIDGDNYNPAVDIEDPSQPISPASHAPNIVRDRIPIPYKSNMYFEQFEYAPTKELEDLCHPTSSTAAATSPSPTHSNPILRTLPNSHIRIYKNGDLMGEPYTSLLAFLPPASKPQAQPGAREGLDDGHLGYYPAVSVFRGGAAEVNFGPNFWRPPRDVVFSSNPNDHETEEDIEMTDAAESSTKLPLPPPAQPVSQRYAEQIAEDTVYDLIDEVELWLQKGGYMADSEPARERSTAVNSGRLGSEDAPGAQIRQAMGSELELVQSGVSNGLQERMS